MITVFLWLSPMIWVSNSHAIYLSVVDLNYQSKATEITVKVFSDDLEDAIYNLTRNRVKMGSDCHGHKEVISSYFSRYLKISVNGNSMKYEWKSCEINDDSIWLSFTGDNPGTIQKISVKADYLMELFPAQTNVINITSGESRRFMKLTINEREATVTFD